MFLLQCSATARSGSGQQEAQTGETQNAGNELQPEKPEKMTEAGEDDGKSWKEN
jgi:hypothetical protein